MYIMGENPVLGFPQPEMVEKALASLDFLVVQDMFMTETARLANVVLPAASFAEREGTFTNFEGRVQRIRKVIEPAGDSLPDWEIILRLADSLGCGMPYSSLQHVMAEIGEMVPFYQISEEGDADGATVYRSELNTESTITRRLYEGRFPSGFGRFSPVRYEAAADTPKDGYPFTLVVGSTPYHAGNGSRTSRSPRMAGFAAEGYIAIGEPDAAQAGIGDGDEVRVVSPWGQLTAVARFTDTLPEGVAFMPSALPSTNVNRLFGTAVDPLCGSPALKACNVKLEGVEAHD